MGHSVTVVVVVALRDVGNRFIVERVVGAIESGEKSLIARLVRGNLEKVTPELISRAALKGDNLAVKIWDEVGRYIGVAVAGLVNLLNPEIVSLAEG